MAESSSSRDATREVSTRGAAGDIRQTTRSRDGRGAPADDGDLRRRAIATGVLLAVGAGGALDLATDASPTRLHVLFEVALLAVSVGAIAWLWVEWAHARRALAGVRAVAASRAAERDAWRARVESLLHGLGAAIDAQLAAWELTPAERETALLLLKGFGHKEIATLLGKSERTVRQQAVAVYRKSGLAGRAELAAFFLEDLLLPSQPAASDHEVAS
jgi:DNA-binding CsgD family transcriptional regulator